MLCPKCEGRDEFDQYLREYLSHFCRWWSLGIDVEASKETLHGFEKVDKRIVTSFYILDRLESIHIECFALRCEEGTNGEEHPNSSENCLRRREWLQSMSEFRQHHPRGMLLPTHHKADTLTN